jgi:hypothetical protein
MNFFFHRGGRTKAAPCEKKNLFFNADSLFHPPPHLPRNDNGEKTAKESVIRKINFLGIEFFIPNRLHRFFFTLYFFTALGLYIAASIYTSSISPVVG